MATRTLGLGRLGLRLESGQGLEFPDRALAFLRDPAQGDFVLSVEAGPLAGLSRAEVEVEAVVWQGRETPSGLELAIQVAEGAPPLAVCTVDLERWSGTLKLAAAITWGSEPAWFSTLLQVVAAHLAVARGALLVHAATALVHGRVWLLAGDSGAGKTTLARQLREHGAELLADDRCVVFAGPPVVASGAPWGGELACRPGEASVDRLLFLEKGLAHELRPLGRAAATARLVAASLGPFWNPRMMGQALTVAKEITGAVVCEEAWLAHDGRAAQFFESQEAR